MPCSWKMTRKQGLTPRKVSEEESGLGQDDFIAGRETHSPLSGKRLFRCSKRLKSDER